MYYAQIYATTAEVIRDLGLSGDETGLLDRIREASSLVQNRLGEYIPVTADRSFVPAYGGKLQIDPCTAVTAVSNNGTALAASDYTPYPLNRHWLNGPFSFLDSQTIGWSHNGVVVSGHWAKYEASQAIAVSSVSQLIGDSTLTVSDGSQVAPGMVLLVESEQQLVTSGAGSEGCPDPTVATSLLNGAIATDDEEITVDNGTEFKRGEVVRIGTEDVYIRRVVGHVLVCARGWNGTTKAAHANDLAVYVYRTFAVERGVNGTTAAAHASKALYRMSVPEDINWLTRQVAGLMRMKARAGFASKSGSAELGETFYYSEFPQTFKRLWETYKVN
jgi:hypothetical protein